MPSTSNSFPIEGAGVEELVIQIYAVRINGKQMSVAAFRQLPIVELCDENGESRPNILPWGVVRYDTKEGNLWLLFKDAGSLFKARLYPERKSNEQLQGSIDLWKGFIERSKKREEVERYKIHLRGAELSHKVEDKRSHAHTQALRNPQLFIGV